MTRRCGFCNTVMDCTETGAAIRDTWTCPTCGFTEGYGVESWPDPERLRSKSDRLRELADHLEDCPVPRAIGGDHA